MWLDVVGGVGGLGREVMVLSLDHWIINRGSRQGYGVAIKLCAAEPAAWDGSLVLNH